MTIGHVELGDVESTTEVVNVPGTDRDLEMVELAKEVTVVAEV